MSLQSKATDIVTIEKRSGEQIGGVRALVQPDVVLIPDVSIPLEEGDLITRRLRSGTEDLFEITDRGFYEGQGSEEPHYQVRIRRVHRRPDSLPVTGADPRRVFLVHGRNEGARLAMSSLLRSLDLRPIDWNEAVMMTGDASPFIGQVIEAGFGAAQAVVVLLTGDDLACLRPELLRADDSDHERKPTPQARPNVLFEAGFALAKHPKRTLLVEIGQLRPFSDMQGRHVIRMNNSGSMRQVLADRLRLAGCKVSLEGTEWHTAGDFELSMSAQDAGLKASRRQAMAFELGWLKDQVTGMLGRPVSDLRYPDRLADGRGLRDPAGGGPGR